MEKKDSRIAVIGIIIEDREKAEPVNSLLHQYSGRYYQRSSRKAGKTSGSQFQSHIFQGKDKQEGT